MLHPIHTSVRSDSLIIAIGVLVGPNTARTRRFIAGFGDFDEVIVGRGFLNSAVMQYVWRDIEGPADIPQLILISRNVEVARNAIRVSPDSLLFRLGGSADIIRWGKAGAPLTL